MEKIIKALMQFLEQHHLSDVQHGFRSGRSCPTNLLFTLERWTKARDEGNVVHAICIDFKKAFDSVPHQRLLHKLRNAGIHGRLLIWIQSFLAGRASTVLGGSHSLELLTVYRPPRSDPEADARLLEELGRFALRPDVLIMGDFNAPLIDWSSLYARGPELAFDRRLVDMAVWSFLTQHVLFPTMVREGQQSNCLDLVLTKSMDSIDEVQCLPPLGPSDHVVLQWEYSTFSVPEQPNKIRRNICARYVDDTFVIIKRDMVQDFHNALNSVSPDIQFTTSLQWRRKATNNYRSWTYWFTGNQRLFMANGYPRNFIERNRQRGPSRSLVTERPKIWRALPYIDGVSEAVSRLLRPLGIGIAHRPESTIRNLVMRPKTPLPRGETTNVIYRIQCSSCEMNYIGETGKRLQIRVGEHMRAVRRMDPLSVVAEHCTNSGHTFALQNAEILGRGNDRITRETIEAWHTGANSINRSVALPEAYQALRTQRSEQKSRVRLRQDRNPSTTESMGDTRAAVLQTESDEGAMFTTAASYTYLAGVRTNDRSNANGPDEGAIITATQAEAYKLQSSEVSVVSRRGSDRIARETIEAWHTGTTSINPCVALPAAYQALPAQLSKQMSRREPRLNMNPDMSESMADAHSVTPQPGSDEGAAVTTVVPSTNPADEKTDSRCGVNKIVSLGRQLRSTKVRTTTTNVSTPVPDVD
ncbi:hypothetical protein SprV_0401709000 [Sparganum proliferum]